MSDFQGERVASQAESVAICGEAMDEHKAWRGVKPLWWSRHQWKVGFALPQQSITGDCTTDWTDRSRKGKSVGCHFTVQESPPYRHCRVKAACRQRGALESFQIDSLRVKKGGVQSHRRGHSQVGIPQMQPPSISRTDSRLSGVTTASRCDAMQSKAKQSHTARRVP